MCKQWSSLFARGILSLPTILDVLALQFLPMLRYPLNKLRLGRRHGLSLWTAEDWPRWAFPSGAYYIDYFNFNIYIEVEF